MGVLPERDTPDQNHIRMRVILTGSIVVGEREIRGVDARGVTRDIEHAMRAAREMGGTHVELALQRPDERGEEIEEQSVTAHDDIAQIVDHQRAEHDGAHTLFGGSAIDLSDGLLCLVNRRHKWQSDWPEIKPSKLRQETVTHRLRSDASLVGDEEHGTSAHVPPSLPAASVSSRAAPGKGLTAQHWGFH